MKALFRMTLQDSRPLFETLTASRKLFLHFRFLANSFVAALSSYVYDTAIRGIFDAFLHTLSDAPSADATAEPTPGPSPLHVASFSDVFALAEHHSTVLDDILSACLLRSNQKAVGDVLRGVLEVILEFGLLMSDLREERVQEYEAAAPLEELFGVFKRRMMALVSAAGPVMLRRAGYEGSRLVQRKSLKGMVDKNAALSDSALEDAHFRVITGSLPRVAASLHDLLTRIEIPESWTS